MKYESVFIFVLKKICCVLAVIFLLSPNLNLYSCKIYHPRPCFVKSIIFTFRNCETIRGYFVTYQAASRLGSASERMVTGNADTPTGCVKLVHNVDNSVDNSLDDKGHPPLG